MRNHTKVYMYYFGFQIAEDCFCEIPGCGLPANDINHIEARGMGGNPKGDKDDIKNLMASCRYHHLLYGDVPEKKEWLKEVHLEFMRLNKKC